MKARIVALRKAK